MLIDQEPRSRLPADGPVDVVAASIDGRHDDPMLLAQRGRAAVARVSQKTLRSAGHVLGPGPLVSEEEYARRMGDLGVYLRQHHRDRDLAYLGELALAAAERRHG
ncbi:hypothetical protein C6A86_005010 [Mycobacterium sp. ITM-2016-00316]|uniref:hypothetical protein n=1 Tax=Mycobacterium sp. ITM-2016-00316 TaxID=2099695 RepID=UPI000CF9C17B|nr:hypothetical protein [Mycobacterium sp. ITM-2016-00316]WNG83043.1 hypothetical protein C6A86_005010 [Mycobacterium sp. ITM-2016-00316]